MILDEKSKLILLQNLFNRATDLAIANGTIKNEVITIDDISKEFDEIAKFAFEKIKKI